MPAIHRIRRYAAYFKGWAQAFGNHQGVYDEARELNWLFSEDRQVGLIMSRPVRRRLFQEILAERRAQVSLTLGPEHIGVDRTLLPCGDAERQAARAIHDLLGSGEQLHLYLAYHLFYPSGTRILTLSPKSPLGIIYKEIQPLDVSVH